MAFSFTSEEKNNVRIFHLEGSLMESQHATTLLEEINELIANDTGKFILDLQELKYMNSTGLGVLISILTKARKAAGEAIICNVPVKIRELLIITKLNTVFTVADNIEQAMKMVGGNV